MINQPRDISGTGGADPVDSGMWELKSTLIRIYIWFAGASVRYTRKTLALPGDKSLLPGKCSHHQSQEVAYPVSTVRKTIERSKIF
jgi:hypothetical protein